MRKEQFAYGERYHIYNRGTGKIDIFRDDEDKSRFLFLLEKHQIDEVHKRRVALAAFVLMPNHFHIAIQQVGEGGISSFFKKVCQSYALYFNYKYARSGCLFSGRFQAKHVQDDAYLMHLTRYIHRNPIPLIGAGHLGQYAWSSYPAYVGNVQSPLLTDLGVIDMFRGPADYEEFVDAWKAGEDFLIKSLIVEE